jgi:hypothetical protein
MDKENKENVYKGRERGLDGMNARRISVTRTDIQNARANHQNPITLAVKRVYQTSQVRTSIIYGTLTVRGNQFTLPTVAQYFLEDFLGGYAVSPISFTPQ